MKPETLPVNEIRELKSEISALRSDLNRYAGQGPGLQGTALLAELRNSCADAIVTGCRDMGCDAIGKKAGDCPLWEKCRSTFQMLFEGVLESIRSGHLTPGEITAIRTRMAEMKDHAPFDRCASCFAESEHQLNQQFRMLEAIGACHEEMDTAVAVRSLPEEAATLFSDALGSAVRLQVLKACYDDAKTFTELSNLTGLRGGNLLFHLEKLIKSDIIRQKGERGEYRITLRGYELAGSIAELYQKIR
ncbi:winged helix-turn-helix domain-containing protein [Methanogenium organophilum]|uniref:Winged helix-turn-helix domain-containing protein n=1 Tax=Methanogenium organophilum TaxID=2199 RepID=A0A9X9S6D7_METOG|nr:winged helix-turn-helix domain-containing protein [Methanogenium organophilum]WAI02331.1 winged helix-turn-helix domain-containing protein [Methanogenium organophilum]